MKANPMHILAGALVIAVLILLAAYKFVYSPNVDEANKIANECKNLETRKEELNNKMLNKSLYSEGIDNSTKIIDAVLAKYGPGFKPEKTIMMAVDMGDSTGADISAITFTPDTVIYSNGIEGSEEPAKNTLVFSKSTVTLSAGYTQFKKVVDFINYYSERMNIDSFNVEYDRENMTINATILMNLYGVIDENHVYVDPEVPEISLGTPNIFGHVVANPEEEELLENGEAVNNGETTE